MRRNLIILSLALTLAGTAVAEDICRSLSARWSDQGTDYRTTVWESGSEASSGLCHKIEHVILRGGVETALSGADCNCDLVADGQEAALTGAPHEATAARLKALCAGPVKAPRAGIAS